MSNNEENSQEQSVSYMVYGLRGEKNTVDGVNEMNLEVLGIFSELPDAEFVADFYSTVDTTVEGVNIASAPMYMEPPAMDIMLKYSVDEEEQACYIRSFCAPDTVEPYIRTEVDNVFCSALVYPEDEEKMTEFFVPMVHKIYGFIPTVVREISPEAEKMIG